MHTQVMISALVFQASTQAEERDPDGHKEEPRNQRSPDTS